MQPINPDLMKQERDYYRQFIPADSISLIVTNTPPSQTHRQLSYVFRFKPDEIRGMVISKDQKKGYRYDLHTGEVRADGVIISYESFLRYLAILDEDKHLGHVTIYKERKAG